MKYTELQSDKVLARVAVFDGGRREAHAILSPADKTADAGFQLSCLAKAALTLAAELKMKPVFGRYLLSDATNQAPLLDDSLNCARSVVQQPPLDASKGVLFVIYEENATFREISEGVWLDAAGHMFVGDLPEVVAADSWAMTVDYLEVLSKILGSQGATLLDNCVRTWFFVRDVDNNYAGVVGGRNEVFAEEGLSCDTHFIASTGIAGQAADPRRLVSFNAFCDTRLRPGQMSHVYAKSHLNPTYEYGVAFERGTYVDYRDRRNVYISGTASIDNKGNIVAPGDIRAQTERMLENIEVLLAEAACGWTDVAHLIVYLRDIADYSTVSAILGARFANIPMAIVLAPVCRPGWLIESECMAIKHIEKPEYEAY